MMTVVSVGETDELKLERVRLAGARTIYYQPPLKMSCKAVQE